MLVDVVCQLMGYVGTQRGKTNLEKDVEYGLSGIFEPFKRNGGPSQLKFCGNVIGYSPSKASHYLGGHAHLMGGEHVMQAIRGLARELIIKYQYLEFAIDIPENGSRVFIQVSLSPEQLSAELDKIVSILGREVLREFRN